MLPGRAIDAAVGPDDRERLVHRAVVAVVVDDHLGPAGDVAGEPDHEPVGVGGGERELPVADAEAAAQLVRGDDGVLGRQHVGDAAAHLGLDREPGRLGAVPRHGARVAQAEVHVLVAVHVAEPRAPRLLDEEGIGTRPLDHPVHRDAVEQ